MLDVLAAGPAPQHRRRNRIDEPIKRRERIGNEQNGDGEDNQAPDKPSHQKASLRCDRRCKRPGLSRILKHDPEKWYPVSRLREARFGGRRKVGKDHAQTNKKLERDYDLTNAQSRA